MSLVRQLCPLHLVLEMLKSWLGWVHAAARLSLHVHHNLLSLRWVSWLRLSVVGIQCVLNIGFVLLSLLEEFQSLARQLLVILVLHLVSISSAKGKNG